jgi:hypothetical protein
VLCPAPTRCSETSMLFPSRKRKTPLSQSSSELYRQREHRLSAKLVPTFEDKGYHVVSVTHPYGRILGFLDRSCYFVFQVAPQLYSRGLVDPVPDPRLLRKSGIPGNRTRTSGSVARNSDHWTTEAVSFRAEYFENHEARHEVPKLILAVCYKPKGRGVRFPMG